MSATWLNGIGLCCNLAGVVAIFFWGVPRYRPVADAGKSYLMMEQDDPKAGARAKLASVLSVLGLGLLFVGFVLQFVALFAG